MLTINRELILLEEIKKLKEENNDLNEQLNDRVVIEDLAHLFTSDEGNDFDWESEIGGLVKDNKELREQLNEESQDRLINKKCWMKVQKQYHELKEENYLPLHAEFMGKTTTSKILKDDVISSLVEENEELKEEAVENKKLFDTTFGEVMKLKEENENLHDQLEDSDDECD